MDLAQPDKDALEAVGSWIGGIVNWFGTFDWGSAPDWAAAVGTVGTLVAALVQLKRERDRSREAEARERRARVLGVVVERKQDGWTDVIAEGQFKGKIEAAKASIHNGSDRPIHRVTWHSPSKHVVGYMGTIRAGETELAGAPLALVPPYSEVIVTFEDGEGYSWLVNSWGKLYAEDSPEFRDLMEDDDPRGGAATPDPVTPQPTPPAPDPSAPAEDRPAPGAAS